jgi:hypothetical protein
VAISSGDAVTRAPAAESAFGHRDTQFFVNLIGQAPEKAHFEAMRASAHLPGAGFHLEIAFISVLQQLKFEAPALPSDLWVRLPRV